MSKIIILYLLIGIVLFSGCVQLIGEKLSFETISEGYYSGHKNVINYVVDDKEKLVEIWNLTMETRKPFPSMPEIDFSKNTVIAVFMGEFATGGYAIEIKDIIEYKDKVTVFVNKTFPEPGSPVTQALSQPYHIVKTKKIYKPIIFEEM